MENYQSCQIWPLSFQLNLILYPPYLQKNNWKMAIFLKKNPEKILSILQICATFFAHFSVFITFFMTLDMNNDYTYRHSM